MRVKYLQCAKCGKRYPREEVRYRCDCGDSIEMVYDIERLRGKIDWDTLRSRTYCHWRYREFYPDLKRQSIITMAEGGTPIIMSRFIGRSLGLKELSFKMESLNPTGSFKDRGSTVEISQAYEYGADQIVCASTGNMGASVAAYCARAGICCTIYVPANTPRIKLLQMEAHGAKFIQVPGDYTLAMQTAKRVFEEKGIYLAGDYPYRGEGEKSVGFEIVDELDGSPDYMVCPIGNGTLLHGIWKGLEEMKTLGLLKRLPKIIGVQAVGCNTIVQPFVEGTNDIIEVDPPRTQMDAIACGVPLDGLWALRALRESGGVGVTVTDEEAGKARDMLARREGIFAELSGAASVAGLIKAVRMGMVEKDSKIVALITGHGLKEPEGFKKEKSGLQQRKGE